MKSILFASLMSVLAASASASEWNNFATVNVTDSEYYFDAESVVKNRDDVTLWIKTVQKATFDTDGSWSTALQWRISCQRRTIMSLGRSTYDANGKFLKSFPAAVNEQSVVPDTVGDAIHKTACLADFPKNTLATSTKYFRITNNDIFGATKALVEIEKGLVDKAPK